MHPQAPNEISDQIYLSPELKAVIGIAAAEFPDSIAAWHARIHPDDRPRVLTAARQYLAGASEQYEVEYRVCHRDGQWRWILSLGRILRDDHGRPVRWAGVDLNITEWKKMERELLRALEDLRVANRIKDEVMANISHELRTPMTVIVAALEILQQEDPPQRNHLFDISAAAAEQLLAIIEDLLDISLLERHEMEIHWQPFALRDCIENAVNETIGRAREKNLDIQLNIGPEIPETVRGDAQRLRQVLLNLLGNAVKFTEAGVIDVHVNCDDHLLVFSVEDTGIGIPAAQMELLFEIFSQADASSTRRHGGTGLGLAISKRLVELMGGKIWAESRPGGGSVFRFTLPL
jgi:PAS domain S-box-containing protein